MDDKLVTVGQFMNNVEAQMGAEALKLEGIESFIADEHTSSTYCTGSVFGVRLQVKESDAANAKRVLNEAAND